MNQLNDSGFELYIKVLPVFKFNFISFNTNALGMYCNVASNIL